MIALDSYKYTGVAFAHPSLRQGLPVMKMAKMGTVLGYQISGWNVHQFKVLTGYSRNCLHLSWLKSWVKDFEKCKIWTQSNIARHPNETYLKWKCLKCTVRINWIALVQSGKILRLIALKIAKYVYNLMLFDTWIKLSSNEISWHVH